MLNAVGRVSSSPGVKHLQKPAAQASTAKSPAVQLIKAASIAKAGSLSKSTCHSVLSGRLETQDAAGPTGFTANAESGKKLISKSNKGQKSAEENLSKNEGSTTGREDGGGVILPRSGELKELKKEKHKKSKESEGEDNKGKKDIPPGLAKKGGIPPGQAKKIEENEEDDDQPHAVEAQNASQPLPGNASEENSPFNNTLLEQAISLISNQPLGGAPQQNANGLPNDAQAINPMTGTPLQATPSTASINPNATATLSGILNNPPARPDPSSIIDTNVMQNLRAGNTAGFIAGLAGNVQSSLNNAAGLFFRLTG